MSTNVSTATGCAVTPAATTAAFRPARSASARSATTRAASLRVPWGYVAGVQCDPIEKKPFFHAWPGGTGLQLRHARLRSALRLLPELGHVAGAARPGGRRAAARRRSGGPRARRRAAGRARRRLDVQRAADHRRMGRRGVQGGARARPGDRLCLQRQRDAAGARLPHAVDRSLQGRSQELRRQAVPQARRTSRSRFSTRFAHCTRADCGSRS